MSSSAPAARLSERPSVSASTALSTAGVLAISSYVAVQMLSDIASVKVGLVGGLAVDMGTFVYPITFTLRDVVHKLLGRRVARLLIVTCGVINLLMAAYLMLVARVSAESIRRRSSRWSPNTVTGWPGQRSGSATSWPTTTPCGC